MTRADRGGAGRAGSTRPNWAGAVWSAGSGQRGGTRRKPVWLASHVDELGQGRVPFVDEEWAGR